MHDGHFAVFAFTLSSQWTFSIPTDRMKFTNYVTSIIIQSDKCLRGQLKSIINLNTVNIQGKIWHVTESATII